MLRAKELKEQIERMDSVVNERRKRSSDGWAHLQLGVYIDKSLWEQFQDKYGPSAEEVWLACLNWMSLNMGNPKL